MRLPRRSPFYGQARDELAYVYNRLYGEKSDTASVESGLGIVRLWIHRAACPQAVESTALLIQSALLDRTHASEYAVRASYSMAITRFVNSVVDSFQTGLYAQSIGAIAERIGLPQWLVQVRHSATHEELPSLSVCRTACERALAWLDMHYWQPTLHAHDTPEGAERGLSSDANDDEDDTSTRHASIVRAAQLVYAYRKQATATLRDASLAHRRVPPHAQPLAQMEQFVREEWERRIAKPRKISTAVRLGRGAQEVDDVPMHDDAYVLASVLCVLITQLLLPGALFPLAELRQRSQKTAWRVPDEAVRVWDPLLLHMHTVSPCFLSLLADALIHTPASNGPYARGWLMHLAHLDADVPRDAPRYTAQGHVVPAAHALSAGAMPMMALRRAVMYHALETPDAEMHALARAVSKLDDDESLRASIAELCRLRDPQHVVSIPADACLAEMEARASAGVPHTEAAPPSKSEAIYDNEHDELAPMGWRRAPSTYEPTPIGCVRGERPALL